MTEIYTKNNINHQELRKNHKIKKKKKKVPLKGYVASLVIFRFGARNKKKKY